MKSALAFAVVAAALAGIATFARTPPPSGRPRNAGPRAAASSPRAPAAPCPPDFLPDDGVCIPAPAPPRRDERSFAIPKLPERATPWSAYSLPLPPDTWKLEDGPPDSGAVRSGVGLRVTRTTRATAPALEGQVGPARVLLVGDGGTLITLHHVTVEGRDRSYLVVLSPIAASGVAPRSELAPGAPLAELPVGSVLRLEVRRVLATSDPSELSPDDLLSDATSTSEDPRNVFPARR
ncbi:MAG TPA: hypothetical protein VHE30_24200 [Polyangiaceae bacterium]|nr:hypothetical protein [Polyangiaceae bacterium]